MTTIELVALDLDGTLLTEDLRYSQRAATAIAAAQDRGVRVTLATGRAFAAARPFAAALGITAPLIGYQGGVIGDPVSGEVLHRATMPDADAHRAIEQAITENLDFNLYVNDVVYVRDLRWPDEFYQRWFGLPIRVAPDLAAVLGDGATKFIIIAEPPEADIIETRWKARFDGHLDIVRSHRLFVEGNPRGVSKGSALAWLAQRLGIPRERVLAVGDNDNDRSMIEWAGVGVAMGNSPPTLQAIADWVAPSVEGDGVAAALDRFVLHHP